MKHIITALLSLAIATPVYSGDDLETTGDLLQIGLPIVTLTSSYLLDDEDTPDNLRYTQFIKSFAYGFIATHALKLAVNKKRPHGGDYRSFPSGHTFAAFSSAAFIHSRFGYRYSIPAFLLSGVVGYSRIHAKAHYADDVLAGAALAFIMNKYVTSPSLQVGMAEGGLNVSMQTTLDEPATVSQKSIVDLSFLIGPTYIQKIDFNAGDSTSLYIERLTQEQEFNFTSNLQVDWLIHPDHTISSFLHPYEHFTSGNLDQDISFDGSTFNNGTAVRLNWVQYDLDIDYLYRLPPWLDFFDFYAGVGLYTNYARLEMTSIQTTTQYKSDRLGFVANLLGKVRANFSQSTTSTLQVNWFQDPVSHYFKLRWGLEYKMNNKWSLVGQFQHYSRTLALTSFDKNNSRRDLISTSSFNDVSLGIKLGFF